MLGIFSSLKVYFSCFECSVSSYVDQLMKCVEMRVEQLECKDAGQARMITSLEETD